MQPLRTREREYDCVCVRERERERESARRRREKGAEIEKERTLNERPTNEIKQRESDRQKPNPKEQRRGRAQAERGGKLERKETPGLGLFVSTATPHQTPRSGYRMYRCLTGGQDAAHRDQLCVWTAFLVRSGVRQRQQASNYSGR